MPFEYDGETLKVVDRESGIELYPEGRPEVDEEPFVFFDPNSTAKSVYGTGRFRIAATVITHAEKEQKADGSVSTHVITDGFRIGRQMLERSFEPYTAGDPARFARVCELVQAGLGVWLRHRSAARNPVISIV